MVLVFAVTIGLIIVVVVLGIMFATFANRNKYFKGAASPEVLQSGVSFYIKKHAIYRLFALTYATVHYILFAISTVTTLITIYMIMDKEFELELQIIFLLISAISGNFLSGFHLDKIAGVYAQAMRIEEKAILRYLENPSIGFAELIEANMAAEKVIEDKFF